MVNRPPDPLGRPVFLDLRRIRFPVGAITSITHRITGALLVLASPAALAVLAYSTRSPAAFRRVGEWLTGVPAALLVAVLAAALVHHLLAGVRILLMDAGLGVRLDRARGSAWASLAAAAAVGLATLIGFWPESG
jgi:succinate dehydrogenase / fumarate reductase cytochrome b subunit